MKKVLCIGDSLALPGHLNKYEDTWFYKLKRKFPEHDFISFFKRQLTTDVLVTMGGGLDGIDEMPKGADCLEFYNPDIVILQLGIVDCAPRLLNKYDKIILKLLPKTISSSYIGIIKRIRKRNLNNTLVPLERFKSNLQNYVSRTKKINARVLIISISIPDHNMVKKNKEIITNVKWYNELYNEFANNNSFISVTQPLQPKDYNFPIYEDGYHPNQKGHSIIFNHLSALFQ